jgi:hypothetical protein
MNYTRPDNIDYEDSPQDWLNSALIFAQALDIVIPEGKGVCIELKGDVINYLGTTKVIVHNDGTKMSIENAENADNLSHGNWVEMVPIDNIKN